MGENNLQKISVKKKESVGQKKLEEIKNKIRKNYGRKMGEDYGFYFTRFEYAKELRDQPYKYFDGMTYTMDYVTNENAKNSFLKPKRNDSEVRIVGGTTEKKIETVANEVLSLNLQHEVRAFNDEDLELSELGQDMGDIVTRTNQIEDDETMWTDTVIELLTQRAVFIEEKYVTKVVKNGSQVIKRAEKELVPGLKMFLGDLTIPAYKFKEQPFIFKYDRVNYDEAISVWGDNPNFKNVIPGMPHHQEDVYLGGAHNYRFSDLDSEEVEIITYYSYPDNEYNVFINGVMMFEPTTSLPYKHEGYPIEMVVLKSVSTEFAYGRPLTASAKNLQSLSDEMIRLLIRKFQQAIEPPLASRKKITSRDIWDPASITYGISAKDYESLIKHDGVTNSEFAMTKFVEDKVMEFIGSSDIQQGIGSRDEKSATEIMAIQRQAAKQLGMTVLAVVRLKKLTTEMRINTLLEHYLKSKGKKLDPVTTRVKQVFQSFTVDNIKLSDGTTGTKVIRLTDESLTRPQKEKLKQKEDLLKKTGKNIRFKFLNVKKLRDLLPLIWYVVVTPQEKEGSALDKIMFQDKLAQGVQVAKVAQVADQLGMNADPIKKDYELKWKAKDWFKTSVKKPAREVVSEQGEIPPGQEEVDKFMEELANLKSEEIGSQVRQGVRGGRTQQPSLNKALSE